MRISLSTSARAPPSSFPVPSHKTTRLRPRGTEDAAVSFFFAVAGLPIGTLAIETFPQIAGPNRPHHYTSPRPFHFRPPQQGCSCIHRGTGTAPYKERDCTYV